MKIIILLTLLTYISSINSFVPSLTRSLRDCSDDSSCEYNATLACSESYIIKYTVTDNTTSQYYATNFFLDSDLFVGMEEIILSTCTSRTNIDTVLNVWDGCPDECSSTLQWKNDDDSTCLSTSVGASSLELTTSGDYGVEMLPHQEEISLAVQGDVIVMELAVSCIATGSPTFSPTLSPTLSPTTAAPTGPVSGDIYEMTWSSTFELNNLTSAEANDPDFILSLEESLAETMNVTTEDVNVTSVDQTSRRLSGDHDFKSFFNHVRRLATSTWDASYDVTVDLGDYSGQTSTEVYDSLNALVSTSLSDSSLTTKLTSKYTFTKPVTTVSSSLSSNTFKVTISTNSPTSAPTVSPTVSPTTSSPTTSSPTPSPTPASSDSDDFWSIEVIIVIVVAALVILILLGSIMYNRSSKRQAINEKAYLMAIRGSAPGNDAGSAA